MLRLDRVEDARAAGLPLIAGGIPMRLRETGVPSPAAAKAVP
jgi:hypothetical protein